MAFSTVATWKLTKWTGPELIRRVPKILVLYDKVIFTQFKEEMSTAQYSWPRTTRRKNKTVVGSPRDIVDMKGLINSQQRVREGRTAFSYKWITPYASLVYNGYTTNRGNVVPARNWIKPALDKVPLDEFFREQWARLAASKL